jgi:hypothetical protein
MTVVFRVPAWNNLSIDAVRPPDSPMQNEELFGTDGTYVRFFNMTPAPL